MEPSPQTYEEVGRLCAAWSYLELVTEQTIWGVLEVDHKIGPIITYKLDMRGRWELLKEWAPRKHTAADCKELQVISTDVMKVNIDRNIIVHGIIHTQGTLTTKPPLYTIVDQYIAGLVRIPCWTVFRGAGAGKNFPISKNAVEMVRLNIQKIADRVTAFNARFDYTNAVTPMPEVETDWPKPI
jgi:hypothetical protein